MAHHHTGLAVAAAGGEEGGVRERDVMPGLIAMEMRLGILIPSRSDLNVFTLALLLPSFFPSWSSHL